MIIDTSALVAVIKQEEGYKTLPDAMIDEVGFIPTPVIVEFRRVTALQLNAPNPEADALLGELTTARISILDYDSAAARASVAANEVHGSGGGLGGPLNMLDLMVYGVAKSTGRPILCTGKDFIATDADIHPSSRRW